MLPLLLQLRVIGQDREQVTLRKHLLSLAQSARAEHDGNIADNDSAVRRRIDMARLLQHRWSLCRKCRGSIWSDLSVAASGGGRLCAMMRRRIRMLLLRLKLSLLHRALLLLLRQFGWRGRGSEGGKISKCFRGGDGCSSATNCRCVSVCIHGIRMEGGIGSVFSCGKL